MKLITPALEINKEDPFGDDVLGNRSDFAESLENLIKRIDDKLVISINADWGEGKTTFIRMWEQSLKIKEINFLYYDAFKNDYLEDPYIDITSEIITFIKKEFSDDKSITKQSNNLQEKAVYAGAKLLGFGAKVALKLGTSAAVDESGIELLEDIKEDITSGPSSLMSSYIDRKIKTHEKDKKSIEEFQNTLNELGEAVKNHQKGFPLVIVIDELDRCRPSYALSILERIKHLFSVDNIVFVLAMNRSQLEHSIRSICGEINAEKYLQKFINVECSLPRDKTNLNKHDYTKFVNYLSEAHELEVWDDKDVLLIFTSGFAEFYELGLRDLEAVFTNIAIYYSSINEEDSLFRYPMLVALLSVVKVINKSLFSDLQKNNLKYARFIVESDYEKFTRIQKTKVDERFRGISDEIGINTEPLTRVLKYCLNTQTFDHTSGGFEDPDSDLYRELQRNSVKNTGLIPLFCDIFDSFHVNQ